MFCIKSWKRLLVQEFAWWLVISSVLQDDLVKSAMISEDKDKTKPLIFEACYMTVTTERNGLRKPQIWLMFLRYEKTYYAL